MSQINLLLDFSLLRKNSYFRAIFIARLMSVLGIGMLNVAVPVQIYELTGSSLQVGAAVALDGAGMFLGLMLGGMLADRMDRKWLILFSRSICGVGFILLTMNAYLSESSILAIYVISLWDGFFSAIGMSALMASIPFLVGRENIASAGALSMLIVRIGSVVSPAVAGIVIVSFGIEVNYILAAIGTLCTLITLVTLPNMKPQERALKETPIESLLNGFKFVLKHKIIRSIVTLGALEAVTKSIRILFPALAATAFGGGALEVGFMYAAIPIGATLGALTSGWVTQVQRSGVIMLVSVFLSFLSIIFLGLMNHLALVLVVLVIFGYLGSISSLLQYTIVQRHTPDHMLGRINSLWTAQNVIGDSAGALGIGLLLKILSPIAGLIMLGVSCSTISIFISCRSSSLRKVDLTLSSTEENKT